jgi:hypothetical protein
MGRTEKALLRANDFKPTFRDEAAARGGSFFLPNSNVPGETLDSPRVIARGSTMFTQLRYPEPKVHRHDAARHT